jgi:GNAT superfamily N-acetyltransferase
MAVPVTVRQASYADKPAIFEFLEKAYPGRSQFKFPERWEWAFQDNPYLAGDVPPVWIAVTQDGQVVGQSAALVEPLVVSGVEHRIGWGVDFFVLPAFRGQGLGTQLQSANNRGNPVFMSLSMAGGAAKIKASLGLQPLPPVPMYTRILHHDPASVRQTLHTRLPFRLGALAGRLGLHHPAAALLTRLGRPAGGEQTSPGEIVISAELGFGPAFDQLWERLAPRFQALVRRDAAYLDWKFTQQPHTTHDIFLARRAGEPCGGLILRQARHPERNAGVLVDLFTDPEDTPAIQAACPHTRPNSWLRVSRKPKPPTP